jgi:hypothetical protein
MKYMHNLVAYVSALVRRGAKALRALRSDAALAHQASTIAQLSRSSGAELRAIYLAPGRTPDKSPPPESERDGRASLGLHLLGFRDIAAMAVCGEHQSPPPQRYCLGTVHFAGGEVIGTKPAALFPPAAGSATIFAPTSFSRR